VNWAVQWVGFGKKITAVFPTRAQALDHAVALKRQHPKRALSIVETDFPYSRDICEGCGERSFHGSTSNCICADVALNEMKKAARGRGARFHT
jgi:hypothetical protein